MTDEEYRAHYTGAFPRLVGQLYVMLGDHAEAQDVVPEAFIRGWTRRGRFATDDRPDAWIRQVAYRLAVSRWRAARSTPAAWHRHGSPPTAAAPRENQALIIGALQRLTEG